MVLNWSGAVSCLFLEGACTEHTARVLRARLLGLLSDSVNRLPGLAASPGGWEMREDVAGVTETDWAVKFSFGP